MVALSAGNAAIVRTLSWWNKRIEAKYTNYDGPDVIGLVGAGKKPLYFTIFEAKIEISTILYPWNLLPRLFILVWLFVIIAYRLHLRGL